MILYTALFLWLLIRHVAPFGTWSVGTPSKLVRGPFPEERVIKTGDAHELKETPVYFEVRNPRKFDHTEMRVKWRGDAPILNVGVVKNQDPWRIETKTLYNVYLEALPWPRITSGEFTLWQRDPIYTSVEDFLAHPPPVEEIATVDVQFNSVISREPGATKRVAYEVSLRGPQDIYLFTAGEDIEVKLLLQDVNRHDGDDPVSMMLTEQGSGIIVARTALEDDGIEWAGGAVRPPRTLALEYKKPSAGVYRLQVAASDDVFIRRLESRQGALVFKNTLYLGDEIGYGETRSPLTIWSNGQRFALRTPHPESVQEVEFEYPEALPPDLRRQGLALEEHNQQYTIEMPWEIAGDLVTITTPKRDVIISTNGFFSLSKDAFFLPEPMRFESDLDLDRLGITYVLAKYAPSAGKNGLKNNVISLPTFDVTPISPLQFFIGAPVGQKNSILLERVQFKLKRPPLTPKRIFDRIKTVLCPVRQLRLCPGAVGAQQRSTVYL